MSNLQLFPPDRRDAVRAALEAAFGVWRVGDFHPVGGGVSGALIFRFEVRERSHVVRLEPDRIHLQDRQRHFACMLGAVEAGVAPRVHYADAAQGIAVTDFIHGRPLSEHAGGSVGLALARALGVLTARLRTAPDFPSMGGYPEIIAVMLKRLAESALFKTGELDAHAEGLADIRSALPWDPASLVPSHNDPNPRNILLDGDRLWLIDWELAARNDPLVDIAILSTGLGETPELDTALLEGRLVARRTSHCGRGWR